MTRNIKLLGSALVTMAAAALLVADSAGPSCRTYLGFDHTYAFTTDCMGSTASGELTVDIPASSRHEPGNYEDAVIQSAIAGGLNLSWITVEYEKVDCTESDGDHGTGTVSWLHFGILPAPPSSSRLGAPASCSVSVPLSTSTVTCERWIIDQQGSSTVQQCTITLTDVTGA